MTQIQAFENKFALPKRNSSQVRGNGLRSLLFVLPRLIHYLSHRSPALERSSYPCVVSNTPPFWTRIPNIPQLMISISDGFDIHIYYNETERKSLYSRLGLFMGWGTLSYKIFERRGNRHPRVLYMRLNEDPARRQNETQNVEVIRRALLDGHFEGKKREISAHSFLSKLHPLCESLRVLLSIYSISNCESYNYHACGVTLGFHALMLA